MQKIGDLINYSKGRRWVYETRRCLDGKHFFNMKKYPFFSLMKILDFCADYDLLLDYENEFDTTSEYKIKSQEVRAEIYKYLNKCFIGIIIYLDNEKINYPAVYKYYRDIYEKIEPVIKTKEITKNKIFDYNKIQD